MGRKIRKTKISEKTLEITPKLDFERSNVDFSNGFAGPCVTLVVFLWSVRGLGFGFVGVLGAFLVFFCVLLCFFVVCSVSWFCFVGRSFCGWGGGFWVCRVLCSLI